MRAKLHDIHSKVDTAIHSSKGRNVLLYLMFVVVAFAFWVMLSLDTEVQRDFEIPIELTAVPDSVTIIDNVPEYVNVSVKGRGGQLIRFTWGKTAPLKIDFKAYSNKGTVYLSRTKLDSRLREYFGNGVSISQVKPDSMRIAYTYAPGTLVKLRIPVDIKTNIQCIVNGPIRASVDSVHVYSADNRPINLSYVETEPLFETGLKDTTTFEVRVKPIAGLRIIPDRIQVTVPVEPLISKKRAVAVDVVNTPAGERVLTFPSKIDINYLVPMSSYNDEYPIRAYVDYVDTYLPGDKVPVKLGALPANYHNATFSPDSVEYLIEK